jgi:hypothetical protein
MLSIVLSLCLFQGPPAPEDPPPQVPLTTSDHLRKIAVGWLGQNGLKLGRQHRGEGEVWVGLGFGASLFSPDDPAFVEGRWFAYQEALMDAKMDFVRFRTNRVVGEIESRVTRNAGTRPVEPVGEEASIDQIIEAKAKQLEVAELDQALREAGVSEVDIQRAESPTSKRDLLARSLRETVLSRGVADLRGVQVLQTFEGMPSPDTAFGVCVLVMFRPENLEVSEAFTSWQATNSSGAAKSGRELTEYLPESQDQWLAGYGVRLVRGPDGNPCVLAFGQAGVLLEGDEDAEDREWVIEEARAFARARAELELAVFAQSSGQFEEEKESEVAKDKNELLFRGGRQQTDSRKTLRRYFRSESKVAAQADLAGATLLHEWGPLVHPLADGGWAVGVVLAWSPSDRLPLRAGKGAGGRLGAEKSAGVTQGKDTPIDW